MIATRFDEKLREVPKEITSLEKAKQRLQGDLEVAKDFYEGEHANYLDQVDYFRALSRDADLKRFQLDYQHAYEGFVRASKFWRSIEWKKAAFLTDLKAALCRGYELDEEGFEPLLERINQNEELEVYRAFFYEYRGQVAFFHKKMEAAEKDLRMALSIRKASSIKKQIARSEALLKVF